jgi:hypothetical protein
MRSVIVTRTDYDGSMIADSGTPYSRYYRQSHRLFLSDLAQSFINP